MTGFSLRWKQDNRRQVSGQVRKAAASAVADATEFLLEESNRTAPIEEGTLIRSGTATSQDLKGAVAWDTPYAARQHEELGYRHDQGRRTKWAEQTFREQVQPVGEMIAGRIRKAVG